MLELFFLGAIVELSVHARPLYRIPLIRTAVAVVSLILIGQMSGALLAIRLDVLSLLIAIISAYRFINLLRIIRPRLPEGHLRPASLRTSIWLITAQLIILFLWQLENYYHANAFQLIAWLAPAQLALASVLAISTVRSVIKTKPHSAEEYLSDADLPSVTIAIPARNETRDLEDCINAALSSDYQKLEILVLDDCSQDNTPEIIRKFAHAGVRFIRGEDLKDGWLAKNQAYERLYQEASGQYILFCGVDVRLGTQAVRTLVSEALTRNKHMVSVLPKRYDSQALSSFIQPARYWWELSLPRRLFRRPPVLSSCWLIEKQAIKKAGGFSAVSRSITPEAYFARELIEDDSYRFTRGTERLEVRTVKPLDRQLDTALRTSYPKVRRRPESVMIITLAELALLLGPFLIVIHGLWTSLEAAHVLAGVSAGLLVVVHSIIITVTNPGNSWLSVINLPAAIVIDIVIAQISMWRYEFSEVIWKGRNVCIPVMRALPRLPELQ
jgi:hypothetical protein